LQTAVSVSSNRLDCSQTTKFLICDIDAFAHKTGSIGLREVARSVLEALTSLRTIASLAKGG
jgi:hypothetical protein